MRRDGASNHEDAYARTDVTHYHIITHDASFADIVDRVIVMKKGRFAKDTYTTGKGTPTEADTATATLYGVQG